MALGRGINTDILCDEIFDALCSMCKNQGRNTEGENFCVECDDYFCIKCVNIHNQVPSCARHKLLDKAQVKSETSKSTLKAPTERCNRHSHKHIDMYCQNHDKIGCTTCMIVDHKSCHDTFYIPEFLKNNIQKMPTKEIQTKLKTIAKTLAEQTDKYKQEKQKLLKRKAEVLAEIGKFRQEINDQLDKLEKSSIAEIESKLKILEDKIEQGLKELQAKEVVVAAAENKLTSPISNLSEEFIHVKKGEEAVNAAKKCIEDSTRHVSLVHIDFYPSTSIITQLKERTNLGILDNLLQTKGEKSYCVKHESDINTCNIISTCYMEDGTIILADGKNRKLKRLDSGNYTVRDYCELPGQPWQVCSINESLVAVTIETTEVNFISLERQMKITSTMNTDFECYGLAYSNNNLYISDSNTSVYMYTLSGKQLRQFSKDQSGHEIFSDIRSLAVSKDASKIYVADYNYGLIVLDNNGQVVSTFNDGEKLKTLCCCYLTEAGSVLVSGYGSSNVVHFTANGELMGEVVKADGAQAVCCNQQMSKMCLNRYAADNIIVHDM